MHGSNVEDAMCTWAAPGYMQQLAMVSMPHGALPHVMVHTWAVLTSA